MRHSVESGSALREYGNNRELRSSKARCGSLA
jgi:hypothetical protein